MELQPAPQRHARDLRSYFVAGPKLFYLGSHAVSVYAELGVLTTLDPGRTADFRRMADQVSYSRLYAAGHFRSDLVAGAYLGALLGDYANRGLTVP